MLSSLPPIELARHLVMYLPRRLWLSQIVKQTAKLDLHKQKIIVLLSSDTEFDPPDWDGSWRTRSTARLFDGLPRLLEICDRYKAQATFFCEGKLVEEAPDYFRNLAKDHEIGCHSFAHEWLGTKPPPRWIPRRDEFQVLSPGAKVQVLGRAAESIGKVTGRRPTSFKAPFNSIDHPSTLQLLEQVGFHSDSSLPCYNSQTFSGAFITTPTRHVSQCELWTEGAMNLIEVPFMVRPRPLFFHPFDTREEIMDTVARGMRLALESVEVQCRVDMASGRPFSPIHITSHPWEFSVVGPAIVHGRANAENLTRFLEEITTRYEVNFSTVNDFVEKWEREFCPTHSHKAASPENVS